MLKTAAFVAILLAITKGHIINESDEEDCDCVSPQFCDVQILVRHNQNLDEKVFCGNQLFIVCCPTNKINNYQNNTIGDQPVCGQRNKNGLVFKLEDSNLESQYGEFPWMIEISVGMSMLDKLVYRYLAGGSLLHPSVVLTAAHKVNDKDLTMFRIRAGEWDQKRINEPLPHQDRKVFRVVTHGQFNPVTGANSVALIFLNEPFKIDRHINTVCLPPAGISFDNAHCLVSGWGRDARSNGDIRVNVLKNIDLQVVPHNECKQMLRNATSKRFHLHQNLLCAGGEEGKDTCNGDGGSPLVCPIPNEEGRYYQAGIVLGNVGSCGLAKVPSLYLKIANYIDWINDHIGEELNFF